ncbi:MAG: nucleotidyl transferase AbiEii/AbiGii toxin family protein [Chloroflexi bacterium]|nr:nucleotidyl transferase AbiEii/AbiGii toxin family protein [Chloroflexota bacterium]
MADRFLELSGRDRLDALQVASSASARPVYLLEKDVWVVWALEALFGGPFGSSLVFKGGTSLSKAYGAIGRFSEDVDLTYDINAIAPDLITSSPDWLPATRSQADRWTREIRKRLPEWVQQKALLEVESALRSRGLPAHARAEDDKIHIEYDPLESGPSYVRPAVTLEFGARSDGQPCATHEVVCDAAKHFPRLVFPSASPRVMSVERTFWEKATAIHVFCAQGAVPERAARHWYDLASLYEAGYVASAIAGRAIAKRVASEKQLFFREKDANRVVIDYGAAVEGNLRLIPTEGAFGQLSKDYQDMLEGGLLLTDAIPFSRLIERCRLIEQEANA